MTEERKCEGLDSWEISAWIGKLGSFPVKRIAFYQGEEDYTKNCAHVLELESKQFAVVTESGCSCYEPADAEIELFPNKARAFQKFGEWDNGKAAQALVGLP